ncbi:hypothetical protein H9N25_10370 [Pedobacter riviphilus]|uniref:Lipoprotein n=1 Tax=Pedobacter riviphilus TaxID=2766984 RepID=A0ABX6TMF5_9SPHI|nr:hypothetical protein [Pedobacter riviphilus]QNR86749.1 hypothetical protein H9N25_10370 [Pedobacter riviphilus]
MKKNYLFSILTFSVLMAGCLDDQTRNRATIDRIYHDVDTASKGLLQFDSFEKIDGKEIQNGNMVYELQFTGFIGAKRNCCWRIAPSKGALASYISKGLTEPSDHLHFGISECTDSTEQSFTKTGWGFKVVGKAYFEKRDHGWQLLDYIMIDSARTKELYLQ